MKNNTHLTENNVQSFAEDELEKCKYHFTNRSPHQSLITAPQTARATFIFLLNLLTQDVHFNEPCSMCDCEKDCTKHIPECFDIDYINIIELTHQPIQRRASGGTTSKRNYSNHMKKICVTNYGDLFRRCTS